MLRIFVAFVLAFSVGPVALAGEATQPPPLRLATGESGGPYHRLATALADSLAKGTRPLAVEALTSTGSYANADLLRDGGAELALLQSDVAYAEYLRDQPFFALAALGSEPIHLLVLRELGAADSSDLSRIIDRPVRVAIGAKGSGTTANALAVLAELEPPPHGFVQRQMSTEEAVRELAARRVDAAFLTASAPAPQLTAAPPELRLAEVADLIDLDT
ncbi:MAG TPA: TAXI family TRAP transporter solute-binding subunit, partial [Thermoanaerobaculia bacterium]|nr:TAXI family TRAP transporter solute-binding subunit [Thermoanaerobaculia bacterium]